MLPLVEVQHEGIVHLIDVVAREYQHIVRVVVVDEFDVLVDGVGRAVVPLAALPAHIGRQDDHAAIRGVQRPSGPGADVGVEHERTILGQYAHDVDVGVEAVAQGKINQLILSTKRNGRFG